MQLFNPNKEDYNFLSEKARNIMLKTVGFFENKGLAKIKEDDHANTWYQDFLDFQKEIQAFATLMTPKGYGASDSSYNTYNICFYNEILGFYGLAYWYTWQVSLLGLGPIWMSNNENAKKMAAKYLQEGEIFAFGLSEKEHGADIISNEMRLNKHEDGTMSASGRKYYIGNANKAAMVSTFARIDGTRNFAFFAVDSKHEKYKCIKNTVYSQSYVAEYELNDYPITDTELLSEGREAFDTSLSTIAICKYNLGWGSIGIATHAFYEAINHAGNRRLFNKFVTDFPHIKQIFSDAYCRLLSMRLFALRASDYMRSASAEDRRYMLYNPMVKMKVTMQGEEVMNLLWDVIAAKGFEKDMYFEMAVKDIRSLPKLEGTAHVNMVLIMKFMNKFLMSPASMPEISKRDEEGNDDFLFNQGSTTKGQKAVQFHDYNDAYKLYDSPNIKIFLEQVEALQELLKGAEPSKDQEKDLDFMLILGELFTLVPYGQLILENSQIYSVDSEIVDQFFDFMVRDFAKFGLMLYSKPSSTEEQSKICLKMIKKPYVNTERFDSVWEKHIITLKDAYVMKE